MKSFSVKLIFFSSLLFLSFSANSQNYLKFIEQGKYWDVLHMEYAQICGMAGADRYFFDHDTTINSIQYWILMRNPIVPVNPGPFCDPLAVDTLTKIEAGIFREDTITKKVYRYILPGGFDSLQWDFDLSLGAQISNYYDPGTPTQYIVDSIGSITMANGISHNVYYTTGVGNVLEFIMEGYGGCRGPDGWLGVGIGFEDFVTCYTESYTPVWNDTITPGTFSTTCFGYWASETWNIQGKTYTDNNGNCVQNFGEPYRSNLKILLYNGPVLEQQTFTNYAGRYAFNTNIATYDVKIDTAGLPLDIVCPASGTQTVVLTPLDSTETDVSFALDCKPGFDVGVSNVVKTYGKIKPGSTAYINVFAGDMSAVYGFNCISGLGGTVTVDITGPATYVTPQSFALVPSVLGNTLTYTIADFGTVNFTSDFAFIIETDTGAQIGNTVCFSVTVTPTAGDLYPSNNFGMHCFPVVNSYDPNEKEVFPIGNISPDNEWLTYTIYFQNTGNAPATHIYITDTLDSNLEYNSFQLLSSSHQHETKLEGNLLSFYFKDIDLPDSTTNEPESHGYVQFRIRQQPLLSHGTVIENSANIFFDLNPAIVTNTTVNTIDTLLLSISEYYSVLIEVFPNPSNGVFNIKTSKGYNFKGGDILEVFTVTGNLVKRMSIKNTTTEIQLDISELPEGIYIYRIRGNHYRDMYGKVVKY